MRGKALVQLLAAELGCRRPVCSRETSDQVGEALRGHSILVSTKERPQGVLETARALEMDASEL